MDYLKRQRSIRLFDATPETINPITCFHETTYAIRRPVHSEQWRSRCNISIFQPKTTCQMRPPDTLYLAHKRSLTQSDGFDRPRYCPFLVKQKKQPDRRGLAECIAVVYQPPHLADSSYQFDAPTEPEQYTAVLVASNSVPYNRTTQTPILPAYSSLPASNPAFSRYHDMMPRPSAWLSLGCPQESHHDLHRGAHPQHGYHLSLS